MSKWGRKGLDTIEVNCTVDIEQTFETGPGDVVIVHDAPIDVAFGERVICWRRATVQRATWYSRLQAHIEGYLALIELFEVGFSAGRTS
jgi:hypothetical protein